MYQPQECCIVIFPSFFSCNHSYYAVTMLCIFLNRHELNSNEKETPLEVFYKKSYS